MSKILRLHVNLFIYLAEGPIEIDSSEPQLLVWKKFGNATRQYYFWQKKETSL